MVGKSQIQELASERIGSYSIVSEGKEDRVGV